MEHNKPMPETAEKKLNLPAVILFGLIACVLYGVGAGLRSDIGILLNPLAEHCGLEYKDVSLCIAIMQLVFGAAQPVLGIIASKKSNRFVLLLGAVLMMLSLLGMMLSSSYLGLLFSLGVLFGLGAGAIAFGLILTSAIHFVGQENAMLISGMLNAAAGMVGFVLSPVLQSLLKAQGLILTLTAMVFIAAALMPVAVFVTSRDAKAQSPAAPLNNPQSDNSSLGLFKEAFGNQTFRLLLAGFITCGFHMVIIESHLFSQFVLYGLNETMASWAYSVYGIATIAGALLSGFLSVHIHKGRLLGFYYGFRAVWVLFYLFLLPKTMITAILFSAGLGLTGDATVSPTSGLVNENFRIPKVATLIGVLFLAHQIGAFCSAWLGGALRQLFGDYTALWLLDVALCVFACIVSLRIKSSQQKPNHNSEL